MKKVFSKPICATLALTLVLSAASVCLAGQDPAAHFADVPQDAWYYEIVEYAAEHGLMVGTSDTTFSPDASMTRAQFVTVLGRMDQIDPAAYPSTEKFVDVMEDDYFCPYIYWAVAMGIALGVDETWFDPDGLMTREQMAAFVYRYLDAKAVTLPDVAEPAPPFRDMDTVSSYALAAVEALRRGGLLIGNDGSVYPLGALTRAEGATVLMRLREALPATEETPDQTPELSPDPELPDQTPDPSPDPELPTSTPEPDPEPEQPAQTPNPDPEFPDQTPEPSDQPEAPTQEGVLLANGKAITDDNIREIIYGLKADYPEGMPWTNANSYYSKALRWTGMGCEGFGLIASDAVFGDLPISANHSDFDRVRVGDLLRINNNTHTVIVLEKRADSVIVAEGNYNSSIHWGREISRANLEAGNFTVRTRYPTE